MKITLVRDCRIDGEHCEAGTVVEVSDRDGSYLVNSGSAKAADKATKAKKAKIKRQKIVMCRACMVGGKHADEGATVTVLERDAAYLLGHGDAVEPDSDDAKAVKATVKRKKDALKVAKSAADQQPDGSEGVNADDQQPDGSEGANADDQQPDGSEGAPEA